MDLKALQARLRDFATARDWQPFHSPKNLAMALMVESAELLELFQWLTTEQSNTLTRDAADKERVGDEIADVLLYLLQLADSTGVDVEEAVERKLRKNAEKYPAKLPEKPVPGPKGHLLIDWENVQPRAEELRTLVPEGTDVWLFHGPKQKVDASGHWLAYGAKNVTLISRSDAGKKNALDFQLSYYIGYISARQPQGRFVVVSNDTGFDPMLEHARELGFDAKRCEFRRSQTVAKPKPRTAVPPAPLPTDLASSVQAPIAPTARDTALAKQVAENAFSNLRLMPIANRPREQNAVFAYLRLFIPMDAKDKEWLARQVWKLLLDRGDLLVNQVVAPVTSPPALPPDTAAANKKYTSAVPVGQAVRRSPVQSKVPAKALAQPGSSKAKTTRKGNGASYPPNPSTPVTPPATSAVKKPASAAKKVAAPIKADPAKVAPKPTAAQIAIAVLASLKKMPKNKPTRRAGLLKFIETHAIKAADQRSIAQQVCALLEARKDVVLSPDGKGVTYPKL
jgi:NTP pyrophosphatase (non-canonical NTP hydrolase)